MGRSAFRGLVSSVLVILLPSALFAADTNAAILYTRGVTWINGTHVPRSSSAVFSGDLVQTRSDSVANINQLGSSVTVLADSLVQFEGTSLKIEHGGVAISTSKGLATTAGEVKVAPASSAWTEFNVTDVDGTVRIAARKGDLTISDGKETVMLAQGQETTREESSDESSPNRKKKKKQQSGAATAAAGGIMNSPWVLGAGGAAIIGVTTWVLVQSDNPASPAKPN
ncbi:MAG TPA: hypothetical protein VGS27_08865 [Candidatus Sulfotelmatobacter sp.]|nr:hypothetical protein [Candidatus Sulfotelmatobacter sp.]